MGEELLKLQTKMLLEKFGAGKHKPGSGSAAAFQGMLSLRLITTVIDLTNHPDDPRRRERYKNHLPELMRIREDIVNRINPRLEELFQNDSDLFDLVIGKRKERDDAKKEGNYSLYHALRHECFNLLKEATLLPIEIAKYSYELGRHAAYVFDNGFQSARGDAGVGLQGAIASMASSLQVIDLNLIHLPIESSLDNIRQQRANLKYQFEEIDKLGKERISFLEKKHEAAWLAYVKFQKYRSGTLSHTISHDTDIEKLVRDFQNLLWTERDQIWEPGSRTHPMQILSPEDVIRKVMKYSYTEKELLGIFTAGEEVFEVAGLIDRTQQSVEVSKHFPKEIMRFTTAHELGHLVLHEHALLHRDRPIDGSSTMQKDIIESQADKFAVYFLMPARIVKQVFEEIFGTERLIISEGTVLALGAGSIKKLRAKCKDALGFAISIASVELYEGKSFNSLARIFGVSPTTMGIRLLELSLVEF